MIDAAIRWYFGWVSRSQILEADRLEAEAEQLKQRAIKLRWEAGLYAEVSGQASKHP